MLSDPGYAPAQTFQSGRSERRREGSFRRSLRTLDAGGQFAAERFPVSLRELAPRTRSMLFPRRGASKSHSQAASAKAIRELPPESRAASADPIPFDSLASARRRALPNDLRSLSVHVWSTNHQCLRLALAPVPWPSPRMRHGDDLDPLIEQTIHDEERKAAQQNAPCIAEVRSRLGRMGNQVDRTIELTTESADAVSFRSRYHRSAASASSAASGWNSTANWGISARRVGDGPLPRESS